MSEPLNHHYVSQVHLKNFFNHSENRIFVYDKLRNNHYYKSTTKSLFSERGLNSIFKDGKIDNSSLEKELNDFFENDFARNIQTIKDFIAHNELNDDVSNALAYFAKYGVIAELRTPRFKKNLDDSLFNAINQLLHNCTNELKKEMDDAFQFKDKVPYSNVLSYTEEADEILSVMGSFIFIIQIPKNKDDFFLIPDIAAATFRERINTYFNPDVKEIAYIGLPLTSKIYLHIYSEKLFTDANVPQSKIFYCNSSLVYKYNKANYDYCQSKVACESEEYLRKFVTIARTHQ